jgi:hypothetical protein
MWIAIFLLVLGWGFWGVQRTDFWQSWETAAVLSTAAYSLLFYVVGFFSPSRNLFKSVVDKHIKYLGYLLPLMAGAVVFLLAAWAVSHWMGDCNLQLLCIFLASLSFLALSVVMSRHSNDSAVREDFKTSLHLNDVPVTAAFLLLLLYSVLYHWIYTGQLLPHMLKHLSDPPIKAFIGGAIAFQMIISNWVFAHIFREPGAESRETTANERNHNEENSR